MSRVKISFLLSYICIASISAAIITPALPQIESHFHLTHGALEWVISIFLLGYTIGQLIYAPLANHYGKLIALRIGLVINLIGIVTCIIGSWTSSYSLLLFGRLITALGAAAGLSCTFMLMNTLIPEQQLKTAMSFTILSFTVGIGFAVFLGGLLTTHLNWQSCFYFLFLHGLFMLIMTWQFQEPAMTKLSINFKNMLQGYLNALSNKKLVSFSLIISLVSVFSYGYSAIAPIYAQTKLGLSPSTYSYWNLINMLGMLASSFISAKLIRQLGPMKLLQLTMVMLIPCLISLILLSHATQASALWFFGTTTILYLLTGLLFSAASFFASNAIKDKASASSMMSFINMGSAMLGVIIMGYLPLYVLSAFNVILVVFYFICVLCLSKVR